MTKIKITSDGGQCMHEIRLPDENGNPSEYVTDSSWFESTASDRDFNFYDIYWAIRDDYDPEGEKKEDGYQIYNWEHPTAVICNGKDVSKDIILIW